MPHILKIKRARTNLLLNQPFFGQLIMQTPIEESFNPAIDTMATDGESIYYNRTFVESLTPSDCAFILAHEVMHIALEHALRLFGRDHKLWNEACDYVINAQLIAQGMPMPKIGLHDPKYAGMCAEDVYTYLKKEEEEDQKKKSSGGGMGMGGIMPPKKNDPASISAQSAKVKIMVKQAVATCGHNVSKLPASLRELIQVSTDHIVDWRRALRDFIDDKVVCDQSWTAPNMTQFALDPDIILPGNVASGLGHIALCIDTSGSIDAKTLAVFENEVNDIITQQRTALVTVLYADDMVRKIVEHDDCTSPLKLDATGGGGTCFEDTFKKIGDLPTPPSVVIYLTDMQVSNHGSDPGCPVMWAVYGSKQNYKQWGHRAPFGLPIHINDCG